jgi:hypothetical protein
MALSDRIISAINQLGNVFILVFLFRRAGVVQPHANAGKMNRFRASCDQFARVKVKRMGAPGGQRPRTLARAPRVQISKKEPTACEHAILFKNEVHFSCEGEILNLVRYGTDSLWRACC